MWKWIERWIVYIKDIHILISKFPSPSALIQNALQGTKWLDGW